MNRAVLGADLEAWEAQEEAGAHSDLVYKIPVAGLNALPYIAHDVHAQNLHCAQLHIAWQVLEVCSILGMLCLLGW